MQLYNYDHDAIACIHVCIHMHANISRLNNLFTIIYFISLSVSTNNSARNLVINVHKVNADVITRSLNNRE